MKARDRKREKDAGILHVKSDTWATIQIEAVVRWAAAISCEGAMHDSRGDVCRPGDARWCVPCAARALLRRPFEKTDPAVLVAVRNAARRDRRRKQQGGRR
jgi:hypothetical protein